MTPSFPTSIVTSRRTVPNVQPIDPPTDYRIAIVGEAPGEDEEDHRTPFVGRSGQLLDNLLRSAGIDRNKCLVGNVCQVRPPGNEISAFPWTGQEIQSGLTQLRHDLSIFQPNICLLLGNTPLRAARSDSNAKVSSWSGSLFYGAQDSPFAARKCVVGFHPAGILRFWGMDGNFARLKAVISRTLEEAKVPNLILPVRELITHYDCQQLCRVMDEWASGTPCSVDIEGGLPNDSVNDGVRADSKRRRYIGWRCVALSARPSKAFAIAWWKFTTDEHGKLLQSFANLMSRTDVPKVLQNSLYDSFVLGYGYGIPVRNVQDDTMLKGWELYCELPKSLTVQASIYTREPHWKDEEMYESTGEALAVGCCKDVSVTMEIALVQDQALTTAQQSHYRKNKEMLNPALYMEYRGINYDLESVKSKKQEVSSELHTLGDRLSLLASTEVRGPSGALADKRLAKTMYESLGYAPQFKKENGRLTSKYTTDIEALLKLRRHLPDDEFLNGVIKHRHLEGLLETLNISADKDGRVRCSYNVVGTETGRFSCKTSPTGAGANMTTITKKLRGNYIADFDYDFFQCDLSGADGWTVAAHCARLGDRRMFNDYLAGLKPAKIISMLYAFGQEVNLLDTESLVYWSSKIPFGCISESVGTGIYDCSKVIQHGTNYMMGIPTMQVNTIKKSFKESGIPIYMEASVARTLQESCYLARYPGIKLWHSWAESMVRSKGTLTSSIGHTRTFFGRRFGKDVHDTVKEFLAHEPQLITTYATNLAMLALWNDPDNRVVHVDRERKLVRTGSGGLHYWTAGGDSFERIVPGCLLIEPLHQVHDALCGQWPKFLRDWARPKLKQYFNNAVSVAGMEFVIPFEGTYGPSWGNMPNVL